MPGEKQLSQSIHTYDLCPEHQKPVRLWSSCCSDLLTANLLQWSLRVQRGAVSITQVLILCQPQSFNSQPFELQLFNSLCHFPEQHPLNYFYFYPSMFNEWRLCLRAENALVCSLSLSEPFQQQFISPRLRQTAQECFDSPLMGNCGLYLFEPLR